MAEDRDTIAAIATPPGRGGIGIVRLSGGGARATALRLVRLRRELVARRPERGEVLHPDDPGGAVIDDALVTWFAAPRSYTGEDVVEIAAHGSPVVLEALLRGAIGAGARLARPGEFTERAFLSGRLGLTQAEAIGDLIAAQTLEQARVAASQLGGALARRVAPAKESLLQLIALLEAGMDFASGELDDVEVVPPAHIEAVAVSVLRPLEELAASFDAGKLLRTGAALALVGRPNAGKSSLFNRLLRRDRAIVTPVPGTTRDTVEEALDLDGIPVRLVDTAGLRAAGDRPADAAEAEGIARSREALAEADLVLVVLDASLPVEPEEFALALSLAGRPHLLVWNKVDLLQPEGHAARGQSVPEELAAEPCIFTSATTGAGIEELRAAMLQQLNAPGAAAAQGAINNLRQHETVSRSVAHVRTAVEANRDGLPHELVLLDLHQALQALDELTGETTTDAILHRIFSTFCIGK